MTATMKRKKTKAESSKPKAIEPAAAQLKLFADEQLARIEHWHAQTQAGPIEVDRIDPSPFNPRTEFDQAELLDLAKTYGEAGVVEPLVVRPLPFPPEGPDAQRFELVAGERRWRAAKLAGLTTVPCVVRNLNDREAGLLQIVENFARRDLNPVEEANGFERACRPVELGGLGYTQAAFAEMIGCSQATVSDRIKLLTMPEVWLKTVKVGKLPARYVLQLAPYAPYHELHKPLADLCNLESGDGSWAFDNEKNFRESAWREVIDATAELEGTHWAGSGSVKWKIKPTPEERQALKLIEIQSPFNRKEAETRALNVKLADKLKAEAIEQAKGKKTARSDREADGPKSKKGKQPTAADLARREKKQAEQFQAKAEELRIDWLRWLIAEKFQLSGHGGPVRWAIDKVLMWVATQSDGMQALHKQDREGDLVAAVQSVGGKPLLDGWELLGEVPVVKRDDVLVELATRWLCKNVETGEPSPMLPADVVEALADELGLDAENLDYAWAARKCGPLTERWLNLHSKDQLAQMVKDLGCPLILQNEAKKKSGLVSALLNPATPAGPLPSELGGSVKKEAAQRKKARR